MSDFSSRLLSRENAHALLLACFLMAEATVAQAAFTIQINPGAGLSGNSAALAAFNRAAQEWSAHFSNNVTVYVDADLYTLVAVPEPGRVLLLVIGMSTLVQRRRR